MKDNNSVLASPVFSVAEGTKMVELESIGLKGIRLFTHQILENGEPGCWVIPQGAISTDMVVNALNATNDAPDETDTYYKHKIERLELALKGACSCLVMQAKWREDEGRKALADELLKSARFYGGNYEG